MSVFHAESQPKIIINSLRLQSAEGYRGSIAKPWKRARNARYYETFLHEDLFEDIPVEIRSEGRLPLPPPQTEEEILRDAERLLRRLSI